jgi:hypothetical protein
MPNILKIKNLSFGSQINQRAARIHGHVRVKFGLVNLTSVGAGNSDANGDFVFNQIRQKIIRAIAGSCLFGQIPRRIRP